MPTATRPTDRALLSQLSQLPVTDYPTFVATHPGLLAVNVIQALLQELSGEAKGGPEAQRKALAGLDYLRRRYLTDQPFPLGPGPLETIWRLVQKGEIDQDEAERLAAGPAVRVDLSSCYARAVIIQSVDIAKEGDWRSGLSLGRIAVAAAQGPLLDATEASNVRFHVYGNFLRLADEVLVRFPDGRIYRQAVDLGEALIPELERNQERDELGAILYRLGSLNLDPYTALTSTIGSADFEAAWRQRMMAELGSQFAMLESKVKLPPVEQALEKARTYYQMASTYRQGQDLGRTLKALAQTLHYQKTLTGVCDEAEFERICTRAIDLLEGLADPEPQLAVQAMLAAHGRVAPPSTRFVGDETQVAQWEQQFGAEKTLQLVDDAYWALREADPSRTLDLLKQARHLLAGAPESDLIKHCRAEVTLIKNALAAPLPDSLRNAGVASTLEFVRNELGRGKLKPETAAATLIGVAADSSARDEEALGLDALEWARQVDPDFIHEYQLPVAFLRATLTRNAGVVAYQAKDMATAARAYTTALKDYIALGLTEDAKNILTDLVDVAETDRDDAVRALTGGLVPVALKIQTDLGLEAAVTLGRVCKRAIAATDVGELVSLLSQMAKGLQFATALNTPPPRFTADSQAREILDSIEQAEHGVQIDKQPSVTPSSFDQLLLSAYAGVPETRPGQSRAERLANLQAQFDGLVNKWLTGAAAGTAAYTTLEQLQQALDVRTVLLDFFLGMDQNGSVAVWTLIVTREDVRIGLVHSDFPDGEVWFGQGALQVRGHPLTALISNFLVSLGEDPGPGRVVTTKGEYELAAAVNRFVGPDVMGYLAGLRGAGKDHLCFVPHGPLHYYPFHLIGDPRAPLAEDWIVTVLPNLGLLQRPVVEQPERDLQDLVAIGLTFSAPNAFDLPPIDRSEPEAKAVASTYGVKPILNEEATEERVSAAMQGARRVHVSTHGRHNVGAPAFQCIFVTPGEDSDGRIYAYEVLSLDLRHLDTLTLSACETALGRFDVADNLRGLPASFFLAGVRTIIGTLWEVLDEASELFFTTYYRSFRSGMGKLDAFATAQRETRKKFPDYRDWGPFTLMGDWR